MPDRAIIVPSTIHRTQNPQVATPFRIFFRFFLHLISTILFRTLKPPFSSAFPIRWGHVWRSWRSLYKLLYQCGALFHTDAVQAVGHLPLSVSESDVDFLSASAHKFNGPKGIGFLYCKEPSRLTPLIGGGQQENGLRGGTENVAAIVGMGVALEDAVSHMQAYQAHMQRLRCVFIHALSDPRGWPSC